jgi:hypothetical protein
MAARWRLWPSSKAVPEWDRLCAGHESVCRPPGPPRDAKIKSWSATAPALGVRPQGKFAMQRVALIYNPASGQHSRGRRAAVDEALAVLREAGVEVEALETFAPGSAGELAAEAVRGGCDTILPAAATAPCMKCCKALSEQAWLWASCRWAPPMRWRKSGPAILSGEGGAQAADCRACAFLSGPDLLFGQHGRNALALLHRGGRGGRRRSLSLAPRPEPQAAARLRSLCDRGLSRLGHARLSAL